jgi:probable rRNA maturation factor
VVRELVLEIDAPAEDRKRIEQLVKHTLVVEGRSLDRVSVSFVDVETMTKLNREQRGKDRATDVLSWPFDADFPQGGGGEVIVCPEQADYSQERILDRLVVHGVLHLLGYEDETDAGLEDMERRTDRVVEAVNV